MIVCSSELGGVACKEKQINWSLDGVNGSILQILNSVWANAYLFIPPKVVKALNSQ